jgi:hypothetical protein
MGKNDDWYLLLAQGDKKKARQYKRTGVVPIEDVEKMFAFFQKFVDASAWTTAKLEEINNKYAPYEAGREAGNVKSIAKKKAEVKKRQKLIVDYFNNNPNPELKILIKGKLKPVSLETFLIHTLSLNVSEKTVNNDLKERNLLHLKTILEKR